MSRTNDVDFRNIRSLDGDRRKGFEEFICQLARRQPPSSPREFRRVDGTGGDGGVEAYWSDNAGGEHGVQAKYFLATKEIDWAQIDKSVRTALELHPDLQTYVVAFACDLTDRSGQIARGKTGWQHWESHKSVWETFATSKGMSVRFDPWTKSTIIDFLAAAPERRGLMLFWFNADVLSAQRLRALFDRTRADLGERFHPEDNVRLSLGRVIHGLTRSPEFRERLASWFRNVPNPAVFVQRAQTLSRPPDAVPLGQFRAACQALTAIAEEIESAGIATLNTDLWADTLDSFWSTYKAAHDQLPPRSSASADPESSRIREAHEELAKISRYVDTNVPFSRSDDWQQLDVAADQKRVAVLVGEPGSGKSHLFADATASCLDRAAPAILMLGQNFFGGDLRMAFRRNLDLADYDFATVLGMLNAAGELAGERTLVLIDALNEAGDLRMWPNGLSGFITEAIKFPHLSVGLSLRPEYWDFLLPEWVKLNAVKFTHRGIETQEEQEQASIQYFEKRGIARPTVPWMGPEFSNFLFLRTVCDSIALSGKQEFPRGIRGSLDVLRLYLETIDEKIRRTFPDAAIADNAVANSARAIATRMAEQKRDYIDAASAISLCQAEFGLPAPTSQQTWLSVLVSEGAFRKDHILPKGVAEGRDPFSDVEQVYRFSYQRFSDHLIVRALLSGVSDVTTTFAPGGPLAYLVEEQDWRWNSLWQALAVQIPEKFAGTELFDVLPRSEHRPLSSEFSTAFEQSLLWRAVTAFSERTLEYFSGRIDGYNGDHTWTLLKLATVGDHPWNADFLHQNLKKMVIAERDSAWTTYLNRSDGGYGEPVWEIVNWCLRAPIAKAETETVRLAAFILCWFFTASNRSVRDSATKALIRVLCVCPRLSPLLLSEFNDVNDLYALERVYAAVYGASARTTNNTIITSVASAVYANIFDRKSVVPNIVLRDYAKGIIDYAVAQSCLPSNIDLSKCSGPFKSEWPLIIPSDAQVEQIANAAGDRRIMSSASGMGDFARYKVEPAVGHFTSVPLSDGRPLNREEKKAKFEVALATWPEQIQSAYHTFERACSALRKTMKLREVKDGDFAISVEYDPTAQQAADEAERRLLESLDPEKKATFEALILPTLSAESDRHEESGVPQFDAESAKRWVVARAYAYGWTQGLFASDTDNNDLSGTRANLERIGKKYQWLALYELLARLSDNVWALNKFPERAEVYDHPAENWFIRDIEPSFANHSRSARQDNVWWHNGTISFANVAPSNVANWPFTVPPSSGPEWLQVTDPNSENWLVLYSMWTRREDRRTEDASTVSLSILRDAFVRISTILVDANLAESVVEKLNNARLADPSGHETIDWTDGPFLIEYPWRSTWTGASAPLEPDSWGSFEGIRYIRPVGRLVWESHLDASLSDGASICVPHPWIGQKLRLRPGFDKIGGFRVSDTGATVFLDPAFGTDKLSSCLVKPTAFFDFLKANNLECIWIVAGELNAYPSGHHGDYSCRSFCGLHRRLGNRWISQSWLSDRSSDRTAATENVGPTADLG